MIGWLTALLFALITVASLSVREHASNLSAPAPPGDGDTTVPPEYQTLLDAYVKNYKLYKEKGEAPYKQAYEAAEQQIQASLDMMRNGITQNQFFIQSFLDDYQDSNPELEELHLKSKKLQEEGPKVADELAASTADRSRPLDTTGIMLRIVVLFVITGVTIAISAFA
jgi:hypothetical protein